MSVLTDVLHKISGIREENYRPIRIEMGEQQARQLAAEFNSFIPTFDPVLLAASSSDYESPKPVTWRDIVNGDCRLWGVRIAGVESPDYLNVIGEEVS